MSAIRNGWTRHGHAIPGKEQTGKQPALVARCGGPAMCRQCALDAGKFRHDDAWVGEDEVAEMQTMAPPEAVGIEFLGMERLPSGRYRWTVRYGGEKCNTRSFETLDEARVAGAQLLLENAEEVETTETTTTTIELEVTAEVGADPLDLERRSAEWRQRASPDARPTDVLAKLAEEVGELARAVIGGLEGRENRGDPREEAAQVVLVVMSLIGRWYPDRTDPDLSLLDAVDAELRRHQA